MRQGITYNTVGRPGNAGAYGFRLAPARGAADLPDLVAQPDEAPVVEIEWWEGQAQDDAFEVAAGRYVMSNRGAVSLNVTQGEPSSIRLGLPMPITPAAIVHPLLTFPLALLAHWRGCATLHAGAFELDGRAWAVAGEREAGKSALLALLGRRGIPIVADDLVVVDGDRILSGPNCVDLRPDAADRLGGTRSLGIVGDRHRHRLTTPVAPAAVALGGFCVLEWSDTISFTELALEERLALVHGQHYATAVGPPHPQLVFDLLELPMWRFCRPRDWSSADTALDHLLGSLSDHAS